MAPAPGGRSLFVATLCVAAGSVVCVLGAQWLSSAVMLVIVLMAVPVAVLFGGVHAGLLACGLAVVPLMLLVPGPITVSPPLAFALLAILGALLVACRHRLDGAAVDEPGLGTGRVRRAATSLVWSERAQQSVEASTRRKADFLALLGHELRNPLFAIQSALAVMRSRRDVQSGQHARAVVERQITHITRLIDDLMDTARVERGSLSLERSTLDLRYAIRTAIEAAEPFIQERGHDFVPQLSHEPLWVSGDRVRLQQVFSNLLLNAAKYTPVGGRIELVASRTYSEICVVVRDSGRGIPSDHLDQIFEPFVRGARDAQGLGMGLYVARTLVEQHGGRITAESPGPNRGATFTVCLPELSPLLRRAV